MTTESDPQASTAFERAKAYYLRLKTWEQVVFPLIVLFFVGGMAVVLFGGGDSPDEPDLGRARVICEEMVSQRLKNPSTADFSYPDVQNSSRIAGTLTGENQLGGKQTLNYSCALSAGTVTDVTVTPR
ncbi:hypothetical protein [Knoellia sp. LjRoot47]|uniref:hypothetical protein n=1 Tax=Knoellia sp. LjRoot47 TaxID=3342330 RepID=UPI003ECF9636